MCRGDAVDHGVGRPRLVGRTLLPWVGQNLQLGDRPRALPDHRAEAVRAGVAATDDDDVLACRDDLVVDLFAERDPVGLREELHGLVDAAELTAGDWQLTAYGRADREHDGVVAIAELRPGQRVADLDSVAEHRALMLHLVDPAIDLQLLHLELRYAIAEEAAGLVVALVHRDGVARAGELLGRGETSGTGADDGDGLAGQPLGRFGADVAV